MANQAIAAGLSRRNRMAKHRTHSIEFKRQVVQDYLGGETLYGLAKRHEISRTLIRVWLAKHEAGVPGGDAVHHVSLAASP
jgi:transposase